MLKISKKYKSTLDAQRGVTAVEFAIVAMLLFTLLFGIFEFGRLFYVFNSVQEVTRRAAREAVVRWIDSDSQYQAKTLALFGATALPAGAEINTENIEIDYLNGNGDPFTPSSLNAGENITQCLSGPSGCIAYVRVRVTGATYVPMVGLFTFMAVPIPDSTVIMPAESLGYTG